MPISTDSICRKVGEKFRRPALYAIKIHSGTKSTQIEPSKTLTDLRTQFLPKKTFLAQFIDFDTRIHTIQNCITEVYLVLIH